MNNTTCISVPFPTGLLMSHLHTIVPILQHIVNLCLTTGDFPISCKSSIVIPLIKVFHGTDLFKIYFAIYIFY